ncbi:FeS cluster assembly scaffold IscU domain-containing protein, putative [Cryptosporidium muris RN66]|uniref:Iron-sulfur cluster assembly protein n=1 Tax=Cryptosporidium muris (strain RN66) TaxID=441375 RepID=B6ABF5_CRYMR|nr:FeS cluster assembly scaffold IscU domain-containing protein, putative [Cryptosporidium muris RN66]EEA05707.1 FeS cluster assembly scaffold IscU domain-containing protein, putative [Cryptosporidium muris RN66]|eukprot:XP_002140056.1 FeS cluster assembly scaffold IscU domain-containing protein [Cryptosporidium muris RN66]
MMIAVRNCITRCKQHLSLIAQKAMYSEAVHDHFRNPRNVGTLPSDKKNVGTAVVGKAACGDVVKLQVSIEDGVIRDAKFKTFGCGSAIASSSYVTELIKGKTPEDALKIKNTDIANYLNLPPVKLHCSLLAEDAVHLAIKDYQSKQSTSDDKSSSSVNISYSDDNKVDPDTK